MTTRAQAIGYLRSVDAAEVVAFLRDAKVCSGWRYFDDEGCLVDMDDDECGPHDAFLETVGDQSVGHVDCQTYRAEHYANGERVDLPRDPVQTHLAVVERAVEDAVIAAGYRVPWRELPKPEPRTPRRRVAKLEPSTQLAIPHKPQQDTRCAAQSDQADVKTRCKWAAGHEAYGGVLEYHRDYQGRTWK